MPLPFDAIVKDLGEVSPTGMVTLFDRPPALPPTPLNVDLSTVTTSADLVYGFGDPPTEVLHLDFQSGASARKHADVLVYQALLYRKYLAPVHSVVVLMRSQAAHPNTSGEIRYAARPGRGKMDFGYEVVRLWEIAAEDLLSAEVGVAPLATLGRLPEGLEVEAGLATVVERLVRRVLAEAPLELGRRLLTAAFVLAGMRIPRLRAKHLFRGVKAMRESDTYLAILDEGREEQAKRTLLLQGQERFGPPGDPVKAAIVGISEDIDRLERLLKRVLTATGWQDLIDTP